MTLERAREAGLRVRVLPRWFDVDSEAGLRWLQADVRAIASGLERTRAFLSRL